MFPPSVPSSQTLGQTRQPLLDPKPFQVFVGHLLHHVHSLGNHNGIFRHLRGGIRVHNSCKEPLM